jgi:hypothetical protein
MNGYADTLVNCVLSRWSPEIGDPTFMGWLTVIGYLAASALAITVICADRFPNTTRRLERGFWLTLAFGLAMLAVNKQLDLQSALTAAGRCVAIRDGWYDDRRIVQTAFIAALLLGFAVAGSLALAVLRRALSRLWLATLGVGWLVTFVLVRAVGFHHVDVLIGMTVGGWRMNWVLELGGIALVSAGAVWAIIRGPNAPTNEAP